MKDNYYIWVEIEANKHRLLKPELFEKMLDRCVASGISSVILSVKDTTGFCLYDSAIAPHYVRLDPDFEERDYLALYLEMAHAKGLKLYAGFDVFAEGRSRHPHPLAPGFVNSAWQTVLNGLDQNGRTSLSPVSQAQSIQTIGAIDDFNEVFVNPVREDVQDYELSLIRELLDKYALDGIVLDRARFVGLGSDFSEYTRLCFETYLKEKVVSWPEDIYSLTPGETGLEPVYGKLFGKWITFRASVICDFIKKVRKAFDESGKKAEFLDYTGSWYPLYYNVGANWASSRYLPEEYPWVDAGEYAATGYAGLLDKLLSGFYYPEVTREQARKNGRPAYWYSVEGSGDLVEKVAGSDVPYVGSLFLAQYKGDPAAFRAAVEMCFQKSAGCMLFDLCYVEDYDWWGLCKL